MYLTVVKAGGLTTVQDEGRPGLAHLGIAPSGWLDAPSARLANRLVGNPPDAAVLETTVTGPSLRVSANTVISVTGARAPVSVDGRRCDQDAPVRMTAGTTLNVGIATSGVRTYIAVRGGIASNPLLGSRSTDLLSGIGPPPLADGQLIPIGPPLGEVPAIDLAPTRPIADNVRLPVMFGPREDWFTDEARSILLSSQWTVTPDSNRVGVRLSGPMLTRLLSAELPPEGTVTGAVQVPPNGKPVILLVDRPVTGGYPILAVVRERAMPLLAQVCAGARVTFQATA